MSVPVSFQEMVLTHPLWTLNFKHQQQFKTSAYYYYYKIGKREEVDEKKRIERKWRKKGKEKKGKGKDLKIKISFSCCFSVSPYYDRL